jgi:hypothetical protein
VLRLEIFHLRPKKYSYFQCCSPKTADERNSKKHIMGGAKNADSIIHSFSGFQFPLRELQMATLIIFICVEIIRAPQKFPRVQGIQCI